MWNIGLLVIVAITSPALSERDMTTRANKIEENSVEVIYWADLSKILVDSVDPENVSVESIDSADLSELTTDLANTENASVESNDSADLSELSIDATKAEIDSVDPENVSVESLASADLSELSTDSANTGGASSGPSSLADLSELSIDSTSTESASDKLIGLADLSELSVDSAQVETNSSANVCDSEGSAPNVFVPKHASIGDKIMDLELTSLSADCQISDTDPVYYGQATFQGPITLEGILRTRYPLPGSESVCFDVLADHEHRLPRFKGDRRKSWFCFNNPEKVLKSMGEEGTYLATIMIDGFSIAHEPKDVMNRANFVQVIDYHNLFVEAEVIDVDETIF